MTVGRAGLVRPVSVAGGLARRQNRLHGAGRGVGVSGAERGRHHAGDGAAARDKKPARVLVRFEDPAEEGHEEWIPLARLKVRWENADAFRAREARWAVQAQISVVQHFRAYSYRRRC